MKQVTITSLTGSEPYSIYICDNTYNSCMYIAQIYDADIPYTFLVPDPYKSLVSVGIKAIDINDCVIKNVVTL